ncbi:MAG: primosomal protein N' [Bacilli bacterium]|nr:primosomal protein N' [Bacilli bacterium]
MKVIKVLIERYVLALDRPFTYVYEGTKDVDVGYRVLVPFNKGKPVVGYVIECSDTNKTKEELEAESGFNIAKISDVLDDKPLLIPSLMKLANKVSDYYVAPLVSVLQTMLPSSLKPRATALKGPKIAYETYLEIASFDYAGLTAKQYDMYLTIRDAGRVLKRELKSPSIIKKLLELGKIKEVYEEKVRLKMPEYEQEDAKALSEFQKSAFESIVNTDKTVSLLQGVTGSGKTEVYLALSEYYISKGKTVIMLVPEISLTPVMCAYFLKRFNSNVAILHSELTDSEKYDEYRRIARGEVQIVVGTRSAIFAPITNIGLIILDEEHVESYKQDNQPCYHAREVALMRANDEGAKVVLGSATPCLETKARAMKGVYNEALMLKRFNEKDLPKTRIIDMSNYVNYARESSIFSKPMIEALKQTLDKKEQAILLVNKRGFSTSVFCRSCGHILRCPNCGIALTYHKSSGLLKCHHCGYMEHKPGLCPYCGSKYLSTTGYGTEKIVEEVNKLFPDARVLRLDSDIGQVRNNIAKTLTAFANLEADVLVGTQMIAKGHDFPNVTLVGVVSADIGLSLPSYRSTERVFQLITQAVGRAGRKEKEGRALIQTFNPNHYAVKCAANQDYDTFYRNEMNVRRQTQYPPYTYLLSIDVIAGTEENAIQVASSIANNINRQSFENVSVLGPISPYIAKENGRFHRLVLVKTKNNDIIRQFVREMLDSLKGNGQINIKVDIDPYTV